MERTCKGCIHNQDHCMKHPALARYHEMENFDWFQDGCDDFWPNNPTCAECRFATETNERISDGLVCHDQSNYSDGRIPFYPMRDWFCPAWRCRVQS